MVDSVWDAAEKSRQWMEGIENDKQAQLDRLHLQIGDALGAATDESHYRQILDALKQFNLPVSQYELKPGGPSWEAMRDAALGQIGKAMSSRSMRNDWAAKEASLYTPYTGTMSGGTPSTTAPSAAPVKPVTPAFDFSALPVTPGITPPRTSVEVGELEAIPSDRSPTQTLDETPKDLPVGTDVQGPLVQAAAKAQQSYPELASETAPVKPITPPYVAPKSAESSQAIVYAPKLPGRQGFVYRFPEGFQKDRDDSDKTPNELKVAEYYKKQLDSEFNTDIPIAQVPGLMDLRKRGVPLKRNPDGTITASDEFLAGSKAAEAQQRAEIAQQRADQASITASEKNYQSWLADARTAGATNSDENMRYIYTQMRKNAEVKYDPTSHQMVVAAKGGEPKDIQSLRAKQADLFNEFKDQGLTKEPSLSQTEYITKARDNGVSFEVKDGQLVPTGSYAPGSKAFFQAENLAVSQQRADQLNKTAKEKDFDAFVKIARSAGSTDDKLQLMGLMNSANNGGILEVDPDTQRIMVRGAFAGTKAESMANQVRIAEEKFDLGRQRLDLASKSQQQRQDLLMQKLEQQKYTQSIDYQSKLAMAKALSQADAKMYPRISAGFTLMGHIQQLDKTIRERPELTNQVVGWLSSHTNWQDVKNELAYMMTNGDQWQKATGRSAQFIKVAMGLASLDAEIDRAYFQGQGNLAEESRKRLDAMVLGLRKAPNADTFINGLNCLKGYVNEIIDTALPSSFAKDTRFQAERAQSVDRLEQFRHKQRGLNDNATRAFNDAVSRGTPAGQSPVHMPAPSEGVKSLDMPVFSSSDPNIKETIKKQLSEKTLSPGQKIIVRDKNGVDHEWTLK